MCVCMCVCERETHTHTHRDREIDRDKDQLCCLISKSCLTLRLHGLQHAKLPCP